MASKIISDSKPNKPPLLSPKPNPDILVKRFSFNKPRKATESDTISTSSSSSSPAIDRSSNIVKKLSAEFEKSPSTDKKVSEKNLFPSLEPEQGQKVEEEFEKLTDESKLDSLLSKDSLRLDEILTQSSTTSERPAPTAPIAEPEPEDEFQDEIQFDPTISSGQLGFGDFRNTPIKLGESRSESVQPILEPLDNAEVVSKATAEPASVEPMTPTEAENLLSSKLAERRVLSDEQAQEVTALLTPDKELPPTPIDALAKLDSLVYNKSDNEPEKVSLFETVL